MLAQIHSALCIRHNRRATTRRAAIGTLSFVYEKEVEVFTRVLFADAWILG